MPDDDRAANKKPGLTRRELFKGLGGGALAAGLLGSGGALERAADASPVNPVLGPGAVKITLTVNGQPRALSVEPRNSLLELLRDQLDLTGAKPACESGACGACTVIVDGLAVNSCMMFALDAWGRTVQTVEGLAHGERLSALQQSFVDHDAVQCGFCTPGMLMSCSALLAHNDHVSIDDVKRAVTGNLCRCGSYPRVVEATLAAAGKKA